MTFIKSSFLNYIKKKIIKNEKKIIYIAGYGRSGSSILAFTLGQHKKIISLGEIRVISSALKNNCST